ncbi:MAG: lytic transglycosylase F, partial [Porphyromonadaceae bacterium]|nr:lytic transglycosylase F [Porphyromonadaceae bacterium]
MLQKILASLRRPTVLFLLVGIAIAIATAVFLRHRTRQATARELQAEQLRLPDTLRVVTLSGATTFFIYRDEPMGYQYELVRLFAESHKLPLKLFVTHSMEEAEAMVEQGRVDLCITPQAMTHSAKERLRFAGPEVMTGLVLVQRKAKTGDSIPYIQDVAALLGKELTVMASSRAEERIKRLEEQLGGKILMHEVTADTISTEDLIAQVASREINYTIADADLAKLSKTYYPQLDISLEVGFAQRLRWFVSPKAIGLADALDKWAKDIPEDQGFHEIYKRYFELSKSDDGEESPLPNTPTKGGRELPGKEDVKEPSHGTQPVRPSPPSTTEKQPKETATHEPTPIGGYGISRFDKLFEKEARRIGWPWQVLASIAYQESNFRPEVVGWSG